jgi:hypothetical protein
MAHRIFGNKGHLKLEVLQIKGALRTVVKWEWCFMICRRVFNAISAQHSVHPTGGSLHVFRQFSWLEVGSGKLALSRPAHQRVTQAVGQFLAK